jgi:hypothetical protein
MRTSRATLPLRQRPLDWIWVGFFVVNLTFICYIVDVEQIIIDDPNDFEYPIWPPRPLVDLVHWWGRNFDPLLMARPTWWKATIWIDSLFFGPFYAVALYAFIRGREWIRIPAIVWGSVLMTIVIIIMSEELFGPHKTDNVPIMVLANASWFLVPVATVVRMGIDPHPFTAKERTRQAAAERVPAPLDP